MKTPLDLFVIITVPIGFLILCLITLCLGCGNHTVIEYHVNTPLEEIRLRSGESDSLAYAEWKKYYEGYRVKCDIYLAPLDVYQTDKCYQSILAHEKRHCYQFDWHPHGQGYEYECY